VESGDQRPSKEKPVTFHDPSGTAGQSVGAHPGDETLAAFVDDTLDARERTRVMHHLAACADCRDAVAGSAAFIASEQTAPPVVRPFRYKAIAIAATGLAAAAAVLLAIWFPRRTPQAAPNLEALVAAYATESSRPVEGRLSGAFAYRAAPAQIRGGSETELTPDIRIAAGRIEEAAARDQSPANLWSLGIAKLTLRDIDGAVDALEEATRDLHAPALDSDLAAAYLARGRNTNDRLDFEKALAATDRALAAMPDLPEALFNRALALQALGRPEARKAWQSAAQRDNGNPWGNEAATRANSLRQ
jgi:tetratricopeptide (TPR) repeat protein